MDWNQKHWESANASHGGMWVKDICLDVPFQGYLHGPELGTMGQCKKNMCCFRFSFVAMAV